MSSCSFNAPLSDEELYRALVDDADQTILDHLANCAYCAENLQQIEEAEMFLNRIIHPRADQLLNYQENLLSPEEWHQIDTHIQRCDVCQEQLNAFDAMREADDDLLDEAQELPPLSPQNQLAVPSPRKPGNPLYASLLRPADASQSLRTLGAASTTSSTRRMQFKAEGLNISLVIKQGEESLRLEGLISGANEGWEESIVTFVSPENDPMTTLGKQWKFSFGSIPSGAAEITIFSIHLGRSLVIPVLEI
ncbi:MAG: hypothetical protein ABI690_15245 [Chloroflexota bacterium]